MTVERSFQSNHLIQLPRLNAAGALTLGTELSATMELVGALPNAVKKAHLRFTEKLHSLRTAMAERLIEAEAVSTENARDADRTLDAAWAATFDWLSGWSKLPTDTNTEVRQKANTLLSILFAHGLKFVQLPYKLEWAESQSRLDRIKADKLQTVFAELGGDAFYKTILIAHKNYGIAIGVTKPKEIPESTVSIREVLDAFLEALRHYVLQVSAMVDPEEPETGTISAKLLAPIVTWQSRVQKQSEEAKEPPMPSSMNSDRLQN